MAYNPGSFEGVLHKIVQTPAFANKVKLIVFQKRWSDFVGMGMREHTWPVKYEKGKLTVVVNNSVWRQELILHNKQLIKKINALGLYLRDIYYILGKPASINVETPVEKKLTKKEKIYLEAFEKKSLKKIKFEGLQKSLLNIRTKQIQRFNE